MADLGELTEMIRKELQEAIKPKTSWGRNELKALIDKAIGKSVIKFMAKK
jgi:hypothetical protein